MKRSSNRTNYYVLYSVFVVQPMVCKPLTHWFVTEFKASPADSYGESDNTDIHDNVHPCRGIGMGGCPSHLAIHDRIVRDVEWEGYIAKPFANTDATLALDIAASTYQYHYREHNEYT